MAWLLESAKAFGLSALALVASISAVFVSILIARWQLSISRAKLQHDLYDRRFAIYMAFHELLVAIVEKDDVEAELRKANAIRAHSPFLLDAQLGAYLERLLNEAFRINAHAKLVKDQSFGSPPERAQQASQLGQDKLVLVNRIDELAREFERFLWLPLASSHKSHYGKRF